MRGKLFYFFLFTTLVVSFVHANFSASNTNQYTVNQPHPNQQFISEELPINNVWGVISSSFSICIIVQTISNASILKWQSSRFDKLSQLEFILFKASHINSDADISLCTRVIVYPHHSFG